MRRKMPVIFAALAMAVSIAAAAPTVTAPDGSIVADAVTSGADNGTQWARVGAGAPVAALAFDGESLSLPQLELTQILVLDSISGEAITAGRLRWAVPDAPEELLEEEWVSANGRLDLACLGGERLMVFAPGYANADLRVVADGRRHTVLLDPQGTLTVTLDPAAPGRVWLAREDRVNVTTLFMNVAEKYEIEDDGVIAVHDLDREATYVGLIAADGKEPIVGTFQGLPKELSLTLADGLAVAGVVKDADGQALAGARVEALGKIVELDSFRYTQTDTTSAEGTFSLSGLLPGEIRVRACADGFACSEFKVDLQPEAPAPPIELNLPRGRDVMLMVQNEVGERIQKAIVISNDRIYETDAQGQLRLEGMVNRESVALQIFGGGFGMWEGSFTADRNVVVITVPGGAVIEQQVLSARRFAPDEVMVRWQAYHANGREGKSGKGEWDAERGVARAGGLESGTYALSVRLPGTATMTSERVEISTGEEIVLAPIVPDRGLAIAGRVLDAETLQPIPGAQVSCEPGSPTVFRAPHLVENVPDVLTDTDGLFLLEGLDKGTCRAIVRASNFATWRLDGVEPDDIGKDIGDVEMDAGMTIVGQVVDRGGRPITGVAVEITEDASYAYFAETTVRTNNEGWFRAERLPVGKWSLTATRGNEKARERVEGRERETVDVEMMLGGMRIEGEVWLGDSRAPGGSVILTTENSQAPGVVVMMQRVTADRQFFGIDQQPMTFAVNSDGRFAGSGLTPGRYYVSYTPAGGGSAPVTKPLDVPHVDTFQCTIQYADAAVSGVVVDDDGLAVAGASVIALAGDGIQEATAFTDGEGRFTVRGLEPGKLVLTADHTEFAPSIPSELDLRDGSNEGPIVLELLPPDGGNVMLAVSAIAGSAGGAPVYLVGPETSTGFTDTGGHATFSGITAGAYRPCGFAYGGATGCGPELMVDDGDQLQASLDLGVGGYIDVLYGNAKSMPTVRVMTTDGVDLSSLLFMASPPQPTAGGLRIGPLQADSYVISIGTATGPRQGTIEVYEGAPAELDLR